MSIAADYSERPRPGPAWRRVLACTALAALAACSAGDPLTVARTRTLDAVTGRAPPARLPAPRPQHLAVCHGHSCRLVTDTGLDADEWRRVAALFEPPPATAGEERRRIAAAVALLERLVGARVGTEHDRGGTLSGLGQPGQLDCVDEATNTTVYLQLLAGQGLLRHHTVAGRQSRGPFTGVLQAPHSTAVIRERASGARFAVDSWFEDNGRPPHIVPLRQWLRGWRP